MSNNKLYVKYGLILIAMATTKKKLRWLVSAIMVKDDNFPECYFLTIHRGPLEEQIVPEWAKWGHRERTKGDQNLVEGSKE
jgi:hypothetical protein